MKSEEANFKWSGTVEKNSDGYYGSLSTEVGGVVDTTISPTFKTFEEAKKWLSDFNDDLLSAGKELGGELVFSSKSA